MPAPEDPTASALSHEAAPFLPPKEHSPAPSEPDSEKFHTPKIPSPLRRTGLHPFIIHGTLIAVYTLILLFSLLLLRSQRCVLLLPPCKKKEFPLPFLFRSFPFLSCNSTLLIRILAIKASVDDLNRQYTTTRFRNLTGNPYAGLPSDEIDAAWATLLAPMHLRVTTQELERDNQVSVALPEGGGYLAWMGVFHELHCVVCFFPLPHCSVNEGLMRGLGLGNAAKVEL